MKKMPKFSFEIGRNYTREEIAEQIAMPRERSRGGPWTTGYDNWKGGNFMFCNVGVAGRTGHDYGNEWDGKRLIWFGKTLSNERQPSIRRMIAGREPVHV